MRVLDWRKSWTPLALVLFLSGFNLVLELEQTQSKMARTAVGSRRVCFLTDVEGNWGYVRNFVRQSTCLRFAANEEAVPTSGGRPADHDDDEELELNDDCFLVYGGDVGDKGGETLQCYEQLVRLKEKYPERVVLLVGNRDVNKMRFTSELHDSELDFKTMAKEIYEGPVWIPLEKRFTLKKFLATQLVPKSGSSKDKESTVEDILQSQNSDDVLEPVNTKVNRLKWMLEHTMGAQGDFERRRKELAGVRSKTAETASAPISDDHVLRSYLESVEDGGVLREYLTYGRLAFVAHDTLFVHGGILTGTSSRISSLGRVPDEPSRQYRSVTEWVDKLNAWYQREVRAWISQPTWTPDRATRGGNELLKYVLPDHPASVVMGRHLDASGMPTPLPRDVVHMLSENGIKRLIVGHTPHGNCPTVIKQQHSEADSTTNTGFEEVVMCDTSYSNAEASDNRGDAASELVLDPQGRVHVHGVLEDARPIAFSTDDPMIGRILRDGTQVKAKFATSGGEDEYLVYSVRNGFSYTYHYRKLHELQALLV